MQSVNWNEEPSVDVVLWMQRVNNAEAKWAMGSADLEKFDVKEHLPFNW